MNRTTSCHSVYLTIQRLCRLSCTHRGSSFCVFGLFMFVTRMIGIDRQIWQQLSTLLLSCIFTTTVVGKRSSLHHINYSRGNTYLYDDLYQLSLCRTYLHDSVATRASEVPVTSCTAFIIPLCHACSLLTRLPSALYSSVYYRVHLMH